MKFIIYLLTSYFQLQLCHCHNCSHQIRNLTSPHTSNWCIGLACYHRLMYVLSVCSGSGRVRLCSSHRHRTLWLPLHAQLRGTVSYLKPPSHSPSPHSRIFTPFSFTPPLSHQIIIALLFGYTIAAFVTHEGQHYTANKAIQQSSNGTFLWVRE